MSNDLSDPREIFNLYVMNIYRILKDEYNMINTIPMFHADYIVLTDKFHRMKDVIDDAVDAVINHNIVINYDYDVYNNIVLTRDWNNIQTSEDWAIIFCTLQNILMWIIRTNTKQLHYSQSDDYFTTKCSKLSKDNCESPCVLKSKRFQGKKCIYPKSYNSDLNNFLPK